MEKRCSKNDSHDECSDRIVDINEEFRGNLVLIFHVYNYNKKFYINIFICLY